MTMKLPVGVVDNQLAWHIDSVHAKRFDRIQCEEQNRLWSNCQKRMEQKRLNSTSVSCPNGKWEVGIDFETVGEIAYQWFLLQKESGN